MDPTLQQLLMQFGQQRMLQPPAQQPGAPPVAYPPLGQSLAPLPNNGVIPTTSKTNDVGQVIDENGNPLQSYAPGEKPFGNAAVGGGGGTTGGAAAPMGGGAAPGQKNALVDALRGIAQPKPPDVVKPSTPHLPPLRPIQGGELIQLMTSLGVGPKDIPSLRQSIGR